MKKLLITLTVLFLTGSVFAYDLPEVIGVLTAPLPDTIRFGYSFTWAGDQNGDGCDDLLVGHNPYSLAYNTPFTNKVYLYHGGEVLGNDPCFTFSSDSSLHSLGRDIIMAGNLIPETESFIIIPTYRYLIRYDRIPSLNVFYYESGSELDSIPEIVTMRPDSSSMYYSLFRVL